MKLGEYIGTPIKMVSIYAAAYGKENGEDRIFAVSSGLPCALYVLNPHDETCVRTIHIEGSRHSWGVVAAPDGNIYIGGDGKLYRYVPGSTVVEDLGFPIEGENYFWRLTVSSSGNIYGGTFPSGKVFEYNPNTRQFRDYGTINHESQYVRSIDVADNVIYLGLGVQRPFLYRMDVVTGEKQEISMPDQALKDSMVYDLNVIDSMLFLRTSPSNDLWVYDLSSECWVDRIEQTMGLDVSSPQWDSPIVYFIKEERLCTYNIKSKELIQLPIIIEESAKGFGWIELNKEPDFPGGSLVSMQKNGNYWLYNPLTGNYKTVSTSLEGQPILINAMIRGPEGDIHIGGYLAGGYARYNPQTEALTPYRGVGQIEGMISHNGMVYKGIYTKAKIYKYDPSNAWVINSNPALLFSLQKHRQDRPFAFTSAGDELAIGTTPDYGQLGGALTMYNPVTGAYEVYEHIVKNQSVNTLAYKDGIIYGGTNVWGGLGIETTDLEGKLFLWDTVDRRKLDELVPITGERAISSLVFDEEGKLWGLTAGYLFRFDPERKVTDKVIECFDYDWSETSYFSRGGFLECIGDGKLVGTTLGKLFVFDQRQEKIQVVAENNSVFATDVDGNLYYNGADKLYKIDKGRL